MTIKEQTGHHGDVQVYAVDEIPVNAKKVDKQFIAASEVSGHVHALCGNYDMYEVDDGYIVNAKEDCVMNHTTNNLAVATWDKAEVLPKKDHRHAIVKRGLYYIGIQQKFDPLAVLKRKVID